MDGTAAARDARAVGSAGPVMKAMATVAEGGGVGGGRGGGGGGGGRGRRRRRKGGAGAGARRICGWHAVALTCISADFLGAARSRRSSTRAAAGAARRGAA
ncbi:proline-rich receptor-like protein kinase PERK1 [Gracilaria domingensis]|nr:proline-rich receptor-like protein kinase PERK1 [Gracilaria domingensis]